MTFWIVRRPFGDNVAKSIGIRKVTKIRNFFTPVLRRGGRRIPFWGFGMRMVFGVKVRKVSHTAIAYFEKIYTTSSPTGINEVTNAIPRRVTDEMNSKLTKTFTSEEVLKALQQLHPTKALGPDGMSAIFFF